MELSLLNKKLNVDDKYFLAGILCLLFVMTRYFSPDFIDNEWAYTLGPIKMLRPSFLINDPFIGGITSTFFVYNTLVSPIYALLNSLTATLVCRLFIWIFQIWALFKLSKTLGIAWWGSLLLFVLWLNAGQNLVAGEWIIECATGKPVAYGFVFLSLDSMLERRLKCAGAFSGAAVSFHVAVGLWSSIALFCTLLLTQYKNIRIKEVLAFCLSAALLSLPGLLPALYGVMLNASTANSSIASSEVAKISVLLANPFHLDPQYFLTGRKFVKIILFLVFSIVLLKSFLSPEKGRPVIVFIMILFVIFVAGILARQFDWYRFLQYYPFRVLDAFLPLSFWMGFVLLFQRIIYKFPKQAILLFLLIPIVIGGANYLIDRFWTKPKYDLTLKSFATAMLITEPRLTGSHVKERGREWYRHAFSQETEKLEEMEFWIKEHTPITSVFITPLMVYSFALKTERAEFVSLKYVPVNENIFTWKERLEALNRGTLKNVGFAILPELMVNYQKLTEEELIKIKQRYGPEYILTTSKERLTLELLYENTSFRLYKL